MLHWLPNKFCPRNELSFLNIDKLVDATVGHSKFSFVNGFCGYSRINMDPCDTHSHWQLSLYSHAIVVTIIFKDMLHSCFKDYAASIIVKSKETSQHLSDLREVFLWCSQYNLQMNPLKCTFDASSGKFFEFTVHLRGIDLDATKAKTIQDIEPLMTWKQLKSFIGRISYVRGFIPGLSWAP